MTTLTEMMETAVPPEHQVDFRRHCLGSKVSKEFRAAFNASLPMMHLYDDLIRDDHALRHLKLLKLPLSIELGQVFQCFHAKATVYDSHDGLCIGIFFKLKLEDNMKWLFNLTANIMTQQYTLGTNEFFVNPKLTMMGDELLIGFRDRSPFWMTTQNQVGIHHVWKLTRDTAVILKDLPYKPK